VRHKVLLFIPHLEQGGAERQILELMRRLPPRYAPSLCVYRRAGTIHYRDYLPTGEAHHDLGVDRMGPRGLARLIRLLRAERPAILHSYRDTANLWARLAALVAPVPVVLTSVRNRYQGPFYGAAERVLQGTGDRVLTNSRGIQDELITWSRVAPHRVQVIHNFVDVDRFRPPTPDERAAARARLAVAPDDVVLLVPGRIAIQKHQLGLAAALAGLRAMGELPPSVRVILAGRPCDRTYGAIVALALRGLGLRDHVIELPPVRDMTALYHAGDAVVLPSLFEGMPNAVLEGHACGLPAVVSAAANRDGIVADGVTGYEVPTLDPRALAGAIARLHAIGPAGRAAMGALGRARIATRFHPDRILAETVALYDELIAAKLSGHGHDRSAQRAAVVSIAR
jgi:glycosyltransferase involved in cell wall biosynthesis